jgi:hypothetical protein
MAGNVRVVRGAVVLDGPVAELGSILELLSASLRRLSASFVMLSIDPFTVVFRPGVVTEMWSALSGSPTAMAAFVCLPDRSRSRSLRSGLSPTSVTAMMAR